MVLHVQTSMNTTTLPQENVASLDSPGFMAYAILVVVITLVSGAMLVFTFFALLMASSIAQILRLFLINLLLAGLMAAVAVALTAGTSAVLTVASSDQPTPPRYLCRLYMWMFGVGAVARLWNLAAFSLSVLTVVRFSRKTISKCYAAAIIAILWIAPMAITLYTLLPYLFEAHFVQGVGCFPQMSSHKLVTLSQLFGSLSEDSYH